MKRATGRGNAPRRGEQKKINHLESHIKRYMILFFYYDKHAVIAAG